MRTQPLLSPHCLDYIALLLIGLIPVLPMLQPYHTLPSPSFYSEWTAFVLGLTASVVLLNRTFWKELLVPKLALYWLGMLAIIVYQGFVLPQTYIAQTLVPALYISWAILLMVLTTWLRSHLGIKKVIYILAWLLLIGGVLQMIVAIL